MDLRLLLLIATAACLFTLLAFEIFHLSDVMSNGRSDPIRSIEAVTAGIAFLGDASSHYPEFFDRYQGCDAALHAVGLALDPALQVDAQSAEDDGYAAARELLDRGAAFDAVFAASDLIAIGAMRALAEAGLQVPRDVAVVGFDDLPTARSASPALTTVSQDTSRAGALLVETLMKRVQDQPADSFMLPAKLVVRRSSSPDAG